MPYQATGRPKGRPQKVAKPVPMHAYADTPPPPRWLDLPPEAAEAWAYLWASCKWLDASRGDGVLVALVATKLAQVANLAARLAKEGSAYFAGNKQWAARPEVKEMQAAEAQLTAWLAALGLSPADRARLNLNAADAGITLAQWRAKRAALDAPTQAYAEPMHA